MLEDGAMGADVCGWVTLKHLPRCVGWCRGRVETGTTTHIDRITSQPQVMLDRDLTRLENLRRTSPETGDVPRRTHRGCDTHLGHTSTAIVSSGLGGNGKGRTLLQLQKSSLLACRAYQSLVSLPASVDHIVCARRANVPAAVNRNVLTSLSLASGSLMNSTMYCHTNQYPTRTRGWYRAHLEYCR